MEECLHKKQESHESNDDLFSSTTGKPSSGAYTGVSHQLTANKMDSLLYTYIFIYSWRTYGERPENEASLLITH
jgi:hypothetical protein